MRIALIVARADNGVIGRDNGLPWRLSEDMKYFKATTMGKPLVMGRKTFESIGRPLPGRTTIVVTRDRDFGAEGVKVTHDLDSAVRLAEDVARAAGVDEVMIAGGAEIYAQALDRAGRIYLTEIHAAFDGDARFPDLDPSTWRETAREDVDAPAGGYGFSFVVLDRL